MNLPSVPFGSIRPRGDRWQLRFRCSGTQTSVTLDSYDAAYLESVRLDALSAEGVSANYLGQTMPLEEVAQLWAQSRHFAESTRRTNQSHLIGHILPTFGHLPLASIRHIDIGAWVDELPVAPKTAIRVLGVLRGIFRFGRDRGWVYSDPTFGIRIDGAHRRRGLNLPNVDQIEQLRLAIDPRYRQFVDLAAYGGCSISEAAGIRVSDLQFDLRIFHVHSTRKQVAEGPPIISEEMKTSTRDRKVPVIPERVWHRLEGISSRNPNDLVIPAPNGGILNPGNFRNRVFQPAVRTVLGDAHELTPHNLRHFAISLWLAAGVTVTEAADWAGHTSDQITRTIYGHALPRSGSDLETETFDEIIAGRSYSRVGLSSAVRASGRAA